MRLTLPEMGEWAVQLAADEASPDTRTVSGEVVLRESTAQ